MATSQSGLWASSKVTSEGNPNVPPLNASHGYIPSQPGRYLVSTPMPVVAGVQHMQQQTMFYSHQPQPMVPGAHLILPPNGEPYMAVHNTSANGKQMMSAMGPWTVPHVAAGPGVVHHQPSSRAGMESSNTCLSADVNASNFSVPKCSTHCMPQVCTCSTQLSAPAPPPVRHLAAPPMTGFQNICFAAHQHRGPPAFPCSALRSQYQTRARYPHQHPQPPASNALASAAIAAGPATPVFQAAKHKLQKRPIKSACKEDQGQLDESDRGRDDGAPRRETSGDTVDLIAAYERRKEHVKRVFAALLEKHEELEISSEEVNNAFLHLSAAEQRLISRSGGLRSFVIKEGVATVEGDTLRLKVDQQNLSDLESGGDSVRDESDEQTSLFEQKASSHGIHVQSPSDSNSFSSQHYWRDDDDDNLSNLNADLGLDSGACSSSSTGVDHSFMPWSVGESRLGLTAADCEPTFDEDELFQSDEDEYQCDLTEETAAVDYLPRHKRGYRVGGLEAAKDTNMAIKKLQADILGHSKLMASLHGDGEGTLDALSANRTNNNANHHLYNPAAVGGGDDIGAGFVSSSKAGEEEAGLASAVKLKRSVSGHRLSPTAKEFLPGMSAASMLMVDDPSKSITQLSVKASVFIPKESSAGVLASRSSRCSPLSSTSMISEQWSPLKLTTTSSSTKLIPTRARSAPPVTPQCGSKLAKQAHQVVHVHAQTLVTSINRRDKQVGCVPKRKEKCSQTGQSRVKVTMKDACVNTDQSGEADVTDEISQEQYNEMVKRAVDAEELYLSTHGKLLALQGNNAIQDLDAAFFSLKSKDLDDARNDYIHTRQHITKQLAQMERNITHHRGALSKGIWLSTLKPLSLELPEWPQSLKKTAGKEHKEESKAAYSHSQAGTTTATRHPPGFTTGKEEVKEEGRHRQRVQSGSSTSSRTKLPPGMTKDTSRRTSSSETDPLAAPSVEKQDTNNKAQPDPATLASGSAASSTASGVTANERVDPLLHSMMMSIAQLNPALAMQPELLKMRAMQDLATMQKAGLGPNSQAAADTDSNQKPVSGVGPTATNSEVRLAGVPGTLPTPYTRFPMNPLMGQQMSGLPMGDLGMAMQGNPFFPTGMPYAMMNPLAGMVPRPLGGNMMPQGITGMRMNEPSTTASQDPDRPIQHRASDTPPAHDSSVDTISSISVQEYDKASTVSEGQASDQQDTDQAFSRVEANEKAKKSRINAERQTLYKVEGSERGKGCRSSESPASNATHDTDDWMSVSSAMSDSSHSNRSKVSTGKDQRHSVAKNPQGKLEKPLMEQKAPPKPMAYGIHTGQQKFGKEEYKQNNNSAASLNIPVEENWDDDLDFCGPVFKLGFTKFEKPSSNVPEPNKTVPGQPQASKVPAKAVHAPKSANHQQLTTEKVADSSTQRSKESFTLFDSGFNTGARSKQPQPPRDAVPVGAAGSNGKKQEKPKLTYSTVTADLKEQPPKSSEVKTVKKTTLADMSNPAVVDTKADALDELDDVSISLEETNDKWAGGGMMDSADDYLSLDALAMELNAGSNDWQEIKKKKKGKGKAVGAKDKENMSNFDKLISLIMSKSPNLTRDEAAVTIQKVRSRRGHLSGLSVDDIVEDALSLIKAAANKNKVATKSEDITDAKNPTPQNPLYKTKICEFWKAGQCYLDKKCGFAHGRPELRSPPDSWRGDNYGSNEDQVKPVAKAEGTAHLKNLYKTKLCDYWKVGKCYLDQKCPYAHGRTELRPPSEFQPQWMGDHYCSSEDQSKHSAASDGAADSRISSSYSHLYKTKICDFWKAGHCDFDKHCNFAHGASELRSAHSVETGAGGSFGEQESEAKPDMKPFPKETQEKRAPPRVVGAVWSAFVTSEKKPSSEKCIEKQVSRSSDDDEMCIICWAPMLMDQKKILECGHSFHMRCVNRWIEREDRTCPICRRHALTDDFPPLGQ